MHTPGPWRGYGHTGYVYGPDVVVCRCGNYRDKELLPFNKDRWAADARLIAAAPDLLDACASVWNTLADASEPTLRALAAECREAVGKALDETKG